MGKTGPRIDLAGNKYNRLTVIGFYNKDKRNRSKWLCRCDCGNTTVVDGYDLKSGNTKSCGCFLSDLMKERKEHKVSKCPTYYTWANRHTRINNENYKFYHAYGGRGIKICDEWNKYENFYRDMGEKPKGSSLDRIDVNGDYCKENCRWATMKEQQNNRTNNKLITYEGKTQTLQQWCEELSIGQAALWGRLYRCKWTIEKAFTTPTRKRNANKIRL